MHFVLALLIAVLAVVGGRALTNKITAAGRARVAVARETLAAHREALAGRPRPESSRTTEKVGLGIAAGYHGAIAAWDAGSAGFRIGWAQGADRFHAWLERRNARKTADAVDEDFPPTAEPTTDPPAPTPEPVVPGPVSDRPTPPEVKPERPKLRIAGGTDVDQDPPATSGEAQPGEYGWWCDQCDQTRGGYDTNETAHDGFEHHKTVCPTRTSESSPPTTGGTMATINTTGRELRTVADIRAEVNEFSQSATAETDTAQAAKNRAVAEVDDAAADVARLEQEVARAQRIIDAASSTLDRDKESKAAVGALAYPVAQLKLAAEARRSAMESAQLAAEKRELAAAELAAAVRRAEAMLGRHRAMEEAVGATPQASTNTQVYQPA